MNFTEFLAETFGAATEEVESWFAPKYAREAEGWVLDRSHQKARMFWGASPLPRRSHFEGIITRPDGRVGALIQLHDSRLYVQGNAGCLASLDQRAINDMLGR